MQNVICAKCHIQALYAECHYVECRCAECRYAEYCGAFKPTLKLIAKKMMKYCEYIPAYFITLVNYSY